MMHWWRALTGVRSQRGCAAEPDGCPLGDCSSGERAAVVCIHCPAHDAQRLRTLGVFEGARVGVVDTRNGILLDVCGSRLALDGAIAMTITVRPIG